MNRQRRLFLKGASGVSVGLPFLPSLMPRAASAASGGGPPRLVLMAQKHGAFGPRLHADLSDKVTNTQMLFAGHQAKWGPIPSSQSAGKTVISPILTANSTVLTPRMLSKLNIIQGLDTPSIGGHNDSAYGNLGTETSPIPSIDQVVAWSPSYYKPGTFQQRSIVAGYSSVSSYHSNPSTRTGTVQPVKSNGDPQRLFDQYFMGFKPPASGAAVVAPVATRKPLVDHVLEHYKLIRNSNRRLSEGDKFRLDGHMQMLSELQRRVTTQPIAAGAGCAVPTRTTKVFPYNKVGEKAGLVTPPDQLRSPAESIALHQLYNDIIAAAFKCGLTRVAVVTPYEKNDTFSSYTKNWHDAAHDHAFDAYQESYQNFFSGVVLDLAKKLDEEESGGTSYLDNSLICWVNEHGAVTHAPSNKMLVTLGGAGGYFKTGNYLDVRNLSAASKVARSPVCL
jgi:hypothetical protein